MSTELAGRIGDELLVAAAIALVAAAFAGALGRPAVARRALLAGTAASWAAVVALGVALLTSDLALTYVVDHSRPDAPAPQRLAGLWGGPEGSLVLWGALTALWASVALARGGTPARSSARALAAAAAATAVPLATAALWADPFDRLRVPAIEGAGLVPILDHPAMLVHPPLLYGALTALVVPFALVFADDGAAVAPRLRGWLLGSWCALTAALALGAAWAYVEVGWGGYWAWDPVESAGLVPWLLVTAWLHQRARRGGRAEDRVGTALAAAPFVLALGGGALVRSGALDSVHAFADAGAVGRALGAGAVAGGALVAVAVARTPRGAPDPAATWREGLLAAQTAALVAAGAVVALGTTWPLLAPDDVAVIDGSFYARVLGPLLPAVVLGAGVAHLGPGRLAPALAGVGAVGGLWLAVPGPAVVVAASAAAGASLALLAIAAARDPIRVRRGLLAHVGAVVLLTAVAASTGATTVEDRLDPGASLSVAGWTVHNGDVIASSGPRVDSVTARLLLAAPDGAVTELRPRLDLHRGRARILPETALHTTWRAHVQLVLLDADDDGRVLLRVGVHPAVPWVWVGAALLVLGGLAGRRRQAPTDAVPQPEPDPSSSV